MFDFFKKAPPPSDIELSELRYRRLFETSLFGILLVNYETGMILDVNKWLIDFLGYSKEEFLERHLWEFGIFWNSGESQADFETLQKKKFVRFDKLHLLTKLGKRVVVQFVGFVFKAGKIDMIQCNLWDITDKSAEEDQLRWLASFPMQETRPIFEIDKRLGIVFANPDAQSIFPDINTLKMNHPLFTDVAAYFEELKSPTHNLEKRQVQINNRWYLEEINLVSPDRLRIHASDITSLKKIEDDLARGKAYDDAILSSISEAVVVTDKNGKINLFNTIAESLTRVTVMMAVGNPHNEVLSLIRENDGKRYDIVDRVLAGGQAEKMEAKILLVTKTGETIPIAGSVSPIKDMYGNTQGCLIIFRDFSLEHDVDKAKTEFVSLASHQMRTPLTVINWYTELLTSMKYGLLADKQSQFTKEINNASKIMTELVDSLLNISRLEMGRFIIQPEPVNITDLAKRNLDVLRLQMQNNKITLHEEYDPTIIFFNADPNLLGIVFQNLLTNSLKYTPAGGSISLSIKREGDLLKITVSDTGVGIPEKDKDKIFTKMFRAENVKTLDPRGTGLGLYIIREIIVNAGGKIWFESVEGKGTIFYVTFPISGMIAKAGDKRLA